MKNETWLFIIVVCLIQVCIFFTIALLIYHGQWLWLGAMLGLAILILLWAGLSEYFTEHKKVRHKEI